MRLFPPGANSHLQWVPHRNTRQKKVFTASTDATAADYTRHLAREALAGPGALGIKPARSSDTGNLVCDLVALDLDDLPAEHLAPILDTLEGFGLYPYVSR